MTVLSKAFVSFIWEYPPPPFGYWGSTVDRLWQLLDNFFDNFLMPSAI